MGRLTEADIAHGAQVITDCDKTIEGMEEHIKEVDKMIARWQADIVQWEEANAHTRTQLDAFKRSRADAVALHEAATKLVRG
jgi:predicted RNase H-like nuclease (RuvC/YqgF family)